MNWKFEKKQENQKKILVEFIGIDMHRMYLIATTRFCKTIKKKCMKVCLSSATDESN